MVYRQKVGRLGTAPKATVQPQTIPAAVEGVDAASMLMGMSPASSITQYNLMPSEYGIRLRKGYREWATGVTGDVRSLIPYDDQGGDSADDRLFAVDENGIWNTTLFNTAAPVQEVVWDAPGGEAGHCVHIQFTTDAGQKVVMVADEVNGLHYYNGDTGVWFRPSITFPDSTTIDDIAFVTTHKQRVWLVKKGSPDAFYLDIDAIQGPATKFNFGSKFDHGGSLVGLWSWTVDGGDGVDDFLVAVSRAGDTLFYYGPDPSQPEWSLRGSYYIGEVPASRQIAVQHAAELFLISVFGIISVRDLLNGIDYASIKVGPAGKINRFLRADVEDDINSLQWQLQVNPSDGFLQVITPLDVQKRRPRQYNQNLLTQAWAWWLDVPALCAEDWRNEYYVGGPDGIVYIYDGGLDNTKLDGTLGLPIDFGGLSSFQPYGEHGQYLIPSFIRAVGVVQGVVSLNVDAVFDYGVAQIVKPPASQVSPGANLWDTGLWDFDVWDFGTTGESNVSGLYGLGRTMAIAWRGSAETRINIVGWDVTFKQGGLL